MGDAKGVDVGRARLPPTQLNDGGARLKVSLLLPLQNSFIEALVNVLCPVTVRWLCIEQWTNSTVKMTLLEVGEVGRKAMITEENIKCVQSLNFLLAHGCTLGAGVVSFPDPNNPSEDRLQ